MLSGWVLVSFGFPSDIWVIPQGYSNRQDRLRWPERSRPLLLRPSRHGIFLQTPARHSVSNIPPYEDYTLHWLNLNTHHTESALLISKMPSGAVRAVSQLSRGRQNCFFSTIQITSGKRKRHLNHCSAFISSWIWRAVTSAYTLHI